MEEAFTDSVLNAIEDGVIALDGDARVRYLNAAAVALCGYTPAEAIGKAVADIACLLRANEERLFGNGRGVALGAVAPTDGLVLVDRHGELRPVRLKMSAIGASKQFTGGHLLVLTDCSREAGLLQRLSYQASHDTLTGLPNRQAFERRVSEALTACTTDQCSEGAILYVDVDQFKVVNDTSGHSAGDRFLVQMASQLRKRVRDSDVLARLGGDEFGVLLHGCAIEDAVCIAKELRRVVKLLDTSWSSKAFAQTVSIGVAPLHGQGQDVASILSAADVACFAAKDRGRDRVIVYNRESVPERHIEMQWVARVSRACDERRFVLYQQPIVPLHGDADDVPHYELLLRMVDRFGQIILPGSFIGAAERYNLMPRMDRWTIGETLDNLVWRDGEALNPYAVAINLSGTSLSDPGFLDFVLKKLRATPIAPGTLCFEITETAAIANIGQVARFMHEVKEAGCQFSLDDFGSGLSSFTYLKELPVDYLKIDGHFMRNLCTDSANAAVVEAFNRIGHALNIKTVAERVEDASTAGRLAELGVDYAQGYYFAKPKKVRGRGAFQWRHRQSDDAALA